jgi:ribosomal protein S18 acetylase RimI-like enzyme
MADELPTTVVIAPFEVHQTNPVIDLWHRCGLVAEGNDPAQDIARKQRVQGEMFLVAELDGEVVGSIMAGYDGHRGWVNYVAVAPEHRRAGLGRFCQISGRIAHPRSR